MATKWEVDVQGAKREGACSYMLTFTGTAKGVAQMVKRLKAREAKLGYRPKVTYKEAA